MTYNKEEELKMWNCISVIIRAEVFGSLTISEKFVEGRKEIEKIERNDITDQIIIQGAINKWGLSEQGARYLAKYKNLGEALLFLLGKYSVKAVEGLAKDDLT